MSQSTLISPAAGSTAAIVGTPPAAQRSAGDGSAAPESFAMALNQASSPPPAAPPRPASARDEERSDVAEADAATAREGAAQQSEHAAAARAATQRKAAAQAAGGANEKSPGAGRATGLAHAEDDGGTPAAHARDTPAGEHTGDAVDAPTGADQLRAALGARTAAAADRSAGKGSIQAAGAAGVDTARAGARATGDASSAAPGAMARRGGPGAEAPTAAGERETASRPSPATAAATAATAPAASATGPTAATLLPTPATPMSTSAPGGPAPTLAEARLQASPGSAEFAPALGAQLHVFLRDGIQHARLQLHPAELGPLTVQILLDGATAQVRLAAEHPLTRQALEQAMPTLAGTLRESGLTLTGGGVFEQPAQPQAQSQTPSQPDGRSPSAERSAAARGDRTGRDAPGQAEAATLRTLAPRRGVVDLVA